MTRKMIDVLDSTASKNDEIEWLCRVRECAGKGTYVEKLFGDKLMQWVFTQIDHDTSADVMEWWTGVEQVIIRETGTQINALKQEINELKTEKWALSEQVRQEQHKNQTLTTSLESSRDTNALYVTEIDRLKERLKALADYNQKLGNEVFELRAERKAIGNFLREALGMKELDTKEV